MFGSWLFSHFFVYLFSRIIPRPLRFELVVSRGENNAEHNLRPNRNSMKMWSTNSRTHFPKKDMEAQISCDPGVDFQEVNFQQVDELRTLEI